MRARGSEVLTHLEGRDAGGCGAAAGGDAAVLAGDGAAGGAGAAPRMDALGSGGKRSYAGFKVVAELLNLLDQKASERDSGRD